MVNAVSYKLLTPPATAGGMKKISPKPVPVKFGASLLQDSRYVLDFSMPVVDQTVNIAGAVLQKMAAEKKALKDPGSIKLLINSPGGSVTHGFKLIGIIKQLDVPVDTVVMGIAASMGAALSLGAASKGRRFMDRYAKIMIHQPSIDGLGGTQEEVDNYNQHLKQIRTIMDGLISRSTGLPIDKVQQMTSKDTYVYPLQALKDGFVDWVLIEGDKGLNKDSIKNLTDDEIKKRDAYNQYDDLPTATFDVKPAAPKVRAFNMLNGGGGGGGGMGDDELNSLRQILADHVTKLKKEKKPDKQKNVGYKEDLIVAGRVSQPLPRGGVLPQVTYSQKPRFEVVG